MDSDHSSQLLEIARELAGAIPDFQVVRGPGHGDRSTLEFMERLREEALSRLGEDFSEKKICRENAFAVDFYIPEEGTIVEVALGLPNPGSEFEKDVLKAIIAQDYGYTVTRLLFISRPGAKKKCSQPGRMEVIRWAAEKHQLKVEVEDLGGEPRRRKRRKKSSKAVPGLTPLARDEGPAIL